MTTHPLRTFVTLAFLAAALLARLAAATDPPEDLVFPGCGPTIQDCIDHTPNGGTLRLATNGPIDEDLEIVRSLSLVAATGFRPVFTPFSIISAASPAAAVDMFVLLRGLTWEPAGATRVVRLQHDGTGTFEVHLIDNAFLGVQGSSLGPIVEVSARGPGGPVVVDVRGNTFRLPATTTNSPLELSFTSPTDGIAVIEDNTVETADMSQRGALALYHTEGDILFYAVHNVVRSKNSAQTAIDVYQTGNGTGRTTARIYGNLLRGIDGGMRFGTAMYAEHGAIDLLVAHNTVLDAQQRAVQVGGRDDFGSDASGTIANNVLVGSLRGDVGIHQFNDTVIERNNMITSTDSEDFPVPPGPYDIVVTDAAFAGADDFRLAPTSLGINAADPTYTPAELQFDLDGNPRVAGPAADLGAYELPCSPDDTAPHCGPTCSEATCQSDDACSEAHCVGDTCHVDPITGQESAFCACDRPLPATCAGVVIPTSITRRAVKACQQLESVRSAITVRQRIKRARTAIRNWGKARRLLKSPRAMLPIDCAGQLDFQYGDAATRALFFTQS